MSSQKGEEMAVGDGASKRNPKPIGLDAGERAACELESFALLSRGPHELIQDQVERTPNAPALIMGSEQILSLIHI